MKQKFDVTGMTCSACSAHVEKAVRQVSGVSDVTVNLLTNSMVVNSEKPIQSSVIVTAVEDAGYGASAVGEKPVTEKPKENIALKALEKMKVRLITSFVFLIPLMYVSMGSMVGLPLPSFLTGHENAVGFALTQFLLCLPVVYINRKYYQVGFKTLLRGSPNMDSLIAIGSSAALIYGVFAIYRIGYGLGVGDHELVMRYHMDLYFESAAMILALITLGKYLEAKSKGKTSEAIEKLIHLAPKTAVVERGEEITIPVEQVVTGDIVVVRPGQSIPVDGVILQGSTSIDEAAITGESIPVEKSVGSNVIAATINKTGFFKFKATKVGQDTTLAQIIRLVEDASASKAPIAKLADKISGVFVPVVIAIAVIAGVVWLLAGQSAEFAISIGISVLVISCPCALGLATPVAIMVGTGKGAENGILIKSGEALETAHQISDVVLDKTGTITQGKPVVTDVLSYGDFTQDAFLALAAGIEHQSEHPLAQAVVNYAKEKQIRPNEVTDFKAVFGKGVQATYENTVWHVGNETLMQEEHITLTTQQKNQMQTLAQSGKTPLLFANKDGVAGIIAMADTIKEGSAAAVQQLQQMGITVTMLTGDNERTAKAIQKKLGDIHVVAQVLPQEKEQHVAALMQKGKTVAMVGDGINDAPALARADVGIAIGAGTDVAIESADIVLMKNNLQDVVTAIQLSKAMIKNIKENLFWAFFYNSIGIPVAAGILYPLFAIKLNPMIGAAAMSLSSVCVVTNALRLKRFKTNKIKKQETIMMKTVTISIEGMMCQHCQTHVEKALNAIAGVSAQVNLEQNQAVCTVEETVSNETLSDAVTQAGYTVVSIG